MNIDGSDQKPLIATEEWDGGPVWSPDGRKIAFFCGSKVAIANLGSKSTKSYSNTGTIMGHVSYPSDFIPNDLEVVAKNILTNKTYAVKHDDAKYTMSLPPGKYIVWVQRTEHYKNIIGRYTQAVVCGMKEGCTDHRFAIVEVKEGLELCGVNPIDYIEFKGAPPFDNADLGNVDLKR